MPSPGPVSAQNTPGTASHLCPKLSDICLPADCQSLFLPHLNILKATPAPVAPSPKPITNFRAEPYQTLRMALAVHEPPGGVYPRGRGVIKRCFQMLHSNRRHVKFKFRKYALLRRSVGILLVHPHFCYPYKKTDTSSPHIPVLCRSLNDNAQNILQLSLKIQECARDES